MHLDQLEILSYVTIMYQPVTIIHQPLTVSSNTLSQTHAQTFSSTSTEVNPYFGW